MAESNLFTMAEDVTRILLKDTEAQKVVKHGINDAKVVQAITKDNFYKNPRFYKIIGALIVAGAGGDYVHIIPLAQEILSAVF